LIHAFNWKKLSVAIAVAFRWDFRRCGLCFQTCPGSYNDVTLIQFLTALKREFRHRRILLVWDGLPSHRSAAMQGYLRAQRSWLTVERLPGYAPDLNPAELVWGNVKGSELANLCADNLGEVEHELRAGLRRVGRSSTLAFAFLRHTGLSF
jgi:transposase